MKKTLLIFILGITILGFDSCSDKKEYIKYGNTIVLMNPFANKPATYDSENCYFSIETIKETRVGLVNFHPQDGVQMSSIDWDYKPYENKVVLIAYYNGAFGLYNWVEEEYKDTFNIEPNRKYEWNPLYNTLEDIGVNQNNDDEISAFDGNWERYDISAYLKISGSYAWFCSNGKTEWTGRFSETEQKLYITAESETYDFNVELSGDNLIVYPGDYSNSQDTSTYNKISSYAFSK